MGFCRRCRCPIPPDMMHNKEQCKFCIQEVSELVASDGTRYEKNFVVKDYEEFLRRLKENPKLRNRILGGNE